MYRNINEVPRETRGTAWDGAWQCQDCDIIQARAVKAYIFPSYPRGEQVCEECAGKRIHKYWKDKA